MTKFYNVYNAHIVIQVMNHGIGFVYLEFGLFSQML